MPHILLINPNTSQATTQMMLEIARASLDGRAEVRGLTAPSGVPMIVGEADLRMAADVVGALDVGDACGVIVAAFGDPGAGLLRRRLAVPVVGIGEAAMREASQHGRFGIATTTPALAASIEGKVRQLGLETAFTGVRLTPGDPWRLGQDPAALEAALAAAVQACVEIDGARAVVIGGGPLGRAAQALGEQFAIPVIGPIPAACAAILRALGRDRAADRFPSSLSIKE